MSRQKAILSVLIIAAGLLFIRPSYAFERETLNLYIFSNKPVYDIYEPKIITLVFANDKTTSILLKPQDNLLTQKRLTVWVRQADKIIKSQAFAWVFKKDILKPQEYLVGNFNLSVLGLTPGAYKINFWFNNHGVVTKSNFIDIKVESTKYTNYVGVTSEKLEAMPKEFNKKAINLAGKHYYSATDRVLDNSIWLNVTATADLLAAPADYRQPSAKIKGYNVLVYGTFYYDESRRFGNFGQYEYYIDVDKIIFLDKLDKDSP